MSHEQLSRPFRKAFSANSTATSFAARGATLTEPSNDGVINLTDMGVLVPCKMLVMPYALGDDDDVFDMAILSWRSIVVSGVKLWVPHRIGVFTCTISTFVGVAASPVLNTERFADTITIGLEETLTADVTRSGTVELCSPTSNLPAHFWIHLNGAQKVEFLTDTTTGDPTSCNALVSFV